MRMLCSYTTGWMDFGFLEALKSVHNNCIKSLSDCGVGEFRVRLAACPSVLDYETYALRNTSCACERDRIKSHATGGT